MICGGASLDMLVLYDDAQREYVYGPALELPEQQGRHLHSGALGRSQVEGLTVISMKTDWKRIIAFEQEVGRATGLRFRRWESA